MQVHVHKIKQLISFSLVTHKLSCWRNKYINKKHINLLRKARH